MCVKGKKLVLFITGICGNKCFFCPISDQKKNKDVIYANEWPTNKTKDILKEAELCDSKGAGITGGDPLTRLARTCKFIKLLKKRFGKDFHIHLYTPLNLVTTDKLEKLYAAGLDEIRFHPNLDNNKDWFKIALAKDFDWDVGIEIPVIPGKLKETKKLIDFAHKKIDFLTLNELEISDTKTNQILKRGFKTKDKFSYAVKGSEDMAKKLIKHAEKYNLSTHFCTATLKDRIQMAERFKRRAKNAAKPYDLITDEGMLVRGAIYIKRPGIDYRKKLKTTNNIKKLTRLRTKLMKKFNIPKDLIAVDKNKQRLLTTGHVVDELRTELKEQYNLIPAIVEEDPTHDNLEIEIDFL